MFQYYIKIIPVTYVGKDRTTFYSNHFSVTKHQKPVHLLSGESGMPGIFFSYELSPFMVKYTETIRYKKRFQQQPECIIYAGF